MHLTKPPDASTRRCSDGRFGLWSIETRNASQSRSRIDRDGASGRGAGGSGRRPRTARVSPMLATSRVRPRTSAHSAVDPSESDSVAAVFRKALSAPSNARRRAPRTASGLHDGVSSSSFTSRSCSSCDGRGGWDGAWGAGTLRSHRRHEVAAARAAMSVEYTDISHTPEARLQRAQVVDDHVSVLHVIATAARPRHARHDQRR